MQATGTDVLTPTTTLTGVLNKKHYNGQKLDVMPLK